MWRPSAISVIDTTRSDAISIVVRQSEVSSWTDSIVEASCCCQGGHPPWPLLPVGVAMSGAVSSHERMKPTIDWISASVILSPQAGIGVSGTPRVTICWIAASDVSSRNDVTLRAGIRRVPCPSAPWHRAQFARQRDSPRASDSSPAAMGTFRGCARYETHG